MKIRAEMGHQRAPLCPTEYQVDKVMDIPNTQFAALLMRPLDSHDFIRRNKVEPHQGTGHDHCLLVLCEGRAEEIAAFCADLETGKTGREELIQLLTEFLSQSK